MLAHDHDNIPRVEPVVANGKERRAAIYLVHGTWAAEAPWTDEKSILTKTIIKAGISGVHVRRLVWSGRNQRSHRDEAAECLASELDANPTIPTVLIGHSHGGSVIHSALMRSITGKQVCGIVCFNTPFLGVLRRNIKERLSVTFWFWFFGGMAGIPYLTDVAPAVFAIAAMVWVAGVLMMVNLYQTKALLKRQEMLVPPRKPCTSRFLCLTTADDEVFDALSTIEAFCNLPVLLLSPWLLWFYMLFAIAFVSGGVLPSLPPLSNSWFAVAGSYSGSVYLWSAAIYFVPFVFAAPAGIVAFGFSQGIWDPLAPYLVRPVVTLAPLSGHVEFDEIPVQTRGELAHSLLYKNQEVCTKVTTWTKESLDHCPRI